MTKKNITIIILAVIVVCILSFITIDLWKSTSDFNEARQARKNIPTKKIQVATSFYPLYFFAQQIGGERINVFDITPSGVDPRSYKLASQDIEAVEKSDLIIVNGLDWELWINDIKNKEAILVASSGLNENQVIESEEGKIDSYIWLSPMMAQLMVTKILAGFLQVDPVNAEYYKSNVGKLRLELDKLNTEYQNGLVNCQDKNIITSYPAFSYLARDYGLSQLLVSGLSVNEKLSSQQSDNITTFAKENSVKYIFFESVVNSELTKTIKEKVGAEIIIFNPIEKKIEKDKNYFTEMRNNLANLKIALRCQ
jgi:zinc transport system substrate-binding protein